ncbi:MAG: hypothetical protein AMJ68_01080 [Acidithiobacillales bacterium SG8_45]|jgi:hypothetical protein|nr:MAG: hypothetical protein AMJ68_01080 [Acidithiobacillales bacterium SG8_45]
MKSCLVRAATTGAILLFSPASFADQCEPIFAFIQLGQTADKCVAAVQKNNKEAKDTLQNYRHCSEVRMIRGAVEKSVNEMPADKINQCANDQQKEYTAAATALQKLYQLELHLK